MAKSTIKISFKVEGLEQLNQTLAEFVKKSAKESDLSAVVGYETLYALYVHEDLQAHHPVGMAKYLELPARLMVGMLTTIVRDEMSKGRRFSQALLVAARELKKVSQQYVPIDTGDLKKSAFAGIERAEQPTPFPL